MPNFNIERIYGISNIFAVVFALIAFVAALMYDGISLWISVIILILPTFMFSVVVCGALFWSFYITKEQDVN
jgi:hypothetical protein